MTAGAGPAVSVVIPAYRSHATIAACLERLAAQTFADREVVVVDSSADDATERIVRARFPWVRYERRASRLLPHAARNLGVALGRAELLVFSDPDVYADPDWLARLVAAHRATGEVIVGSLACFGRRWLDQGVHLCKFSKWLPAPRPRLVDMSPTANMLVSRRDFVAAGGFPGDRLLGDVTFSARLVANGKRLWFERAARVEHHHLHSLSSFLAERYERGRQYGELRCHELRQRRGAILAYLAATVLPVRLPRILGLVALHSCRAGQARRYVLGLPLIAAGHAASLAGEAATYVRRLGSAPGLRARTRPSRASAPDARRPDRRR
jgi:GT2 family glycosyltransferase